MQWLTGIALQGRARPKPAIFAEDLKTESKRKKWAQALPAEAIHAAQRAHEQYRK